MHTKQPQKEKLLKVLQLNLDEKQLELAFKILDDVEEEVPIPVELQELSSEEWMLLDHLYLSLLAEQAEHPLH
jgi:hypothetical protein